MLFVFLFQTMPRNYKRKTNRDGWSEDSMIEALDAVKSAYRIDLQVDSP